MSGIAPFSIASVLLPSGGRIGLCRLPGRSGQLAEDVAIISAWQPAHIVTLTEKAEMARLGASALQNQLSALQMSWSHFPIVDFGIPDQMSHAAWPVLSARLHTVLNAGGSVLVHCHGGLGRSGMVALRLLVEAGEEAQSALARLRLIRPGAVETQSQYNWATLVL
jgi:predicted protein tyrosine phosphatase